MVLCSVARAADWPLFLNDARHSGAAAAPAAPPLTQKWTFNTDSTITTSPVKAGDLVFAGTRGGALHALDAYTGTTRWQYNAFDSIGGSPAVADGRVYFNSADGQFHCVDAKTGALIWRFTTSGQDLGTPTVANGVVYVGTGFPNNNLLALNAETGAWLWQVYVDQPILSAPAVKDGVVWIGAGNGIFYGIDAASGVVTSQVQTGGMVYFASPSILDSTAFVTGGEYDRKIYAVSLQNGAALWSAEPVTDSNIVKTSSISSDNGKIYISIGYPNHKTVAIDASNGNVLWQYNLGDGSSWNFLSTPVVAGDVVFVGTQTGYLTALNSETGALVAQVSVGEGIVSAPAVADGMVFITTTSGKINAYVGTDTVPPTVSISAPGADAVIGGQVTVTGTAMDGNLKSYTLEYGEGASPTAWTRILAVPGGINVDSGNLGGWNTEGLSEGVYTIRLSGEDVNGNSANVTVTVTLSTSSAPVFAGLKSAGRGGDDLTALLTWDAASGASEPITYNIYKASAAGAQDFNSAPLANVAATSASVSGLTYDREAYFVVRAINALGNMDANTVEKSYLPADTVPPAFAGLASVTRGASDTVAVLNWGDAADNHSEDIFYDVYMAGAPGGEIFSEPPLTSFPATTTTTVDVPYGTHAYFVVRAHDLNGNQDANTVEMDFMPVDTVPPEFSGLVSVTRGAADTTAVLAWEAGADNAGSLTYDIYKATESGAQNFNEPPAANAAGTSAEITVTYGEHAYFVVRARDGGGNHDTNTVEQDFLPVDTTPPAFAGLVSVARGDSDTEVVLNWEAAVDAGGTVMYEVYTAVAPGAQDFAAAPLLSTSETTGRVQVPQEQTTYFVVRAKDTLDNKETNTVEMYYTPGDTTPPAFAGLVSVARGDTDTEAVLNWEAGADAGGTVMYGIYAAAAPGAQDFASAPLLSTSETTGRVQVSQGQTTYFVVRAKDASGNAETNTVEKSYTPGDTEAPAFAGLASVARGDTDTEAVLNWEAATDSGTVTYEVFSAAAPGTQDFDAAPLLSTTATTARVQTPYGQTTYFIVRAKDDLNNRESNTVEKSYSPVDTTPPSFGGLISVSDNGTGDSLTLSWSPAQDAGGQVEYNIFIAMSAEGFDFGTPNSKATGSPFVVTGLKGGTEYYFIVRAKDAAGNEETNTELKSGTPTADVEHLYYPEEELSEQVRGSDQKDSSGWPTKALVDGSGRELVTYTDWETSIPRADSKAVIEVMAIVYDVHGNGAPGISVKLKMTNRTAASSGSRTAFADSELQVDTGAGGIAVFQVTAADPGEYEAQLEIGGRTYGSSFRMVFAAVQLSLAGVHTYPNPWRPGNQLCFAGVITAPAWIKITLYDIRGARVLDAVNHADPTVPATLTPAGGDQRNLWCGDAVNNGGRPLANGVYIYYLEATDAATGAGATAKGKLSIVR